MKRIEIQSAPCECGHDVSAHLVHGIGACLGKAEGAICLCHRFARMAQTARYERVQPRSYAYAMNAGAR